MPILSNFLENYFSARRAGREEYQILDNPANPPNAFLDAGELAFANNGNRQSLYSSWTGNQFLNFSSNAAGNYVSPWAGLGTRAIGAGVLSAIQTGNPLVGLLVGGVSALSSLPEAISQQQTINKQNQAIKQQQAKERQQLLRDQRQEKILQMLEKYYTEKHTENKSAAPTPATPTTPGTPGTPQTLAPSITQNFITPDTTPTSAYFRSYSTYSSPMRQTDLSGFSLLMSPRNSARLRYQNIYNV